MDTPIPKVKHQFLYPLKRIAEIMSVEINFKSLKSLQHILNGLRKHIENI